MRSSVSRSQTFSSFTRASSCSSREVVSGDRDARGFSETSLGASSRDDFGWDSWGPDPECSDRIVWGETREEEGG